jgi:hypothetical protein
MRLGQRLISGPTPDFTVINLLYCVYDSDKHLREARFSVLTALRYLEGAANEYRIVVCTTQPEIFSSFPVTLEPLDEAILKDWRGPNDFQFRTKIMAMIRVMDQYRGPTVLLDSDTYFTRSPRRLLGRLKPGVSIMDRPDGRIFHVPAHIDFARELKRTFPELTFPLAGGDEFRTSEAEAEMWVAGIVGLHDGDRMLLGRVLQLNDAIYERFPHTFVEQFSFTEILRQNTRLIASRPVVEHYWGRWIDPYYGLGRRDFFHAQIDAIFKDNPEGDYRQAMRALRSRPIRKFRRPMHYRAMTGVRKLWTRIFRGTTS